MSKHKEARRRLSSVNLGENCSNIHFSQIIFTALRRHGQVVCGWSVSLALALADSPALGDLLHLGRLGEREAPHLAGHQGQAGLLHRAGNLSVLSSGCWRTGRMPHFWLLGWQVSNHIKHEYDLTLHSRLSGSQTYLFLFVSCIGHAIPCMMFPFHKTLLAMCVNSFIFGLFDGTFHTSANVLLLDIWRGRKSSPYMYTMHLFFGLGSFLTPLVTESFQSREYYFKEHLSTQGNVSISIEHISPTAMAATDISSFWNVDNLYLIIGAALAFSSVGYVHYYFVDRRFEYTSLSKQEDVLALSPVEEEKLLECEEEIMFSASRPPPAMSRNKRLIFILLMTSFNFFFAGVEGSFKNFIPAFSSHCLLHLSRQEGSSLSGLFFGTYTVNRILLIVGSMYASATTDMWLSLFLCALSCAVLHTWGQSHKLGLQIGLIRICCHYRVQKVQILRNRITGRRLCGSLLYNVSMAGNIDACHKWHRSSLHRGLEYCSPGELSILLCNFQNHCC